MFENDLSPIDLEMQPAVKRLTKDLVGAAKLIGDREARFLVDAYYQMQEDRKRSDNQVRQAGDEPSATLAWMAEQNRVVETQIARMLDAYSNAHPIGRAMRQVKGIGPILAAGLLAHIDIKKAPTVGHIWRFAGLDCTVSWNKGEKRPWNASLKTLCWKVGMSFLYLSNDRPNGVEASPYGRMYRVRKKFETRRNELGAYAEQAAAILAKKKFGKDTTAYKEYAAGRLPLAHIDARARRWAVKMFLSHLHQTWWEFETGTKAPVPYVIAHLNHVDYIPLPPEFAVAA